MFTCSRLKASNAASSRVYRKKKSRDAEFRHLESERVKKWQRKIRITGRKKVQKKSKRIKSYVISLK